MSSSQRLKLETKFNAIIFTLIMYKKYAARHDSVKKTTLFTQNVRLYPNTKHFKANNMANKCQIEATFTKFFYGYTPGSTCVMLLRTGCATLISKSTHYGALVGC